MGARLFDSSCASAIAATCVMASGGRRIDCSSVAIVRIRPAAQSSRKIRAHTASTRGAHPSCTGGCRRSLSWLGLRLSSPGDFEC
ncbi:hypothetical protein MRB53_039475 [Persea americana]|nr:hypothetical protein MRB53_039475 [Persea americana]